MASQDSFLARQTWGLSNWLWIAMAALFVLAFVPRGARLAMQGAENQAKDWLPANYPESVDLAWFAEHFSSAQFVLASWEGCTLDAEDDRLRLLADKLHRELDDRGQRVFTEILTGPEMVASLTRAPANLSRPAAVTRLEGALVGPKRMGADGQPLADSDRVTCLIAYLSPRVMSSNRRMRDVIERIEQIATQECGVPAETFCMAGPPVDNVTIDKQGKLSLRRLALFAGLIGLGIAYVSFRSWKLTFAVFAVAAMSAGASLAIVYWFGIVEVHFFGMASPRLGKMDAILNSMPAVVYVLGLSGAIHVVNYYRDERAERGVVGAAERGVRISWGPCLLAAVTTAVGLGSLSASEIVPVEKFGVLTGISVLATVAILFTVLPVLLHLMGEGNLRGRRSVAHGGEALPAWARRFADLVTRRYTAVGMGCCGVMLAMALGLPQIESSVELLKLLDDEVDLIHDYAWVEENLGNLVPVEVVVALDPNQQRAPDDLAETALVELGGPDRYRMTMVERLRMVRRIQQRIEEIDSVSRALSAATFAPEPSVSTSRSSRRAADYTTSVALEEPDTLAALAQYVRPETAAKGEVSGIAALKGQSTSELSTDQSTNARQLWRVSARVAALQGVDYGQFLAELRAHVAPVITAYRARDRLVAQLHAQGKTLADARVAVVYRQAEEDSAGQANGKKTGDSAAIELFRLLRDSDTQHAPNAISAAKLAQLTPDIAARYNERLDAVVSLDDPQAASLLAASGLRNVVNLSGNATDDGGFASTYTGIVPLVYKTQGELLSSLRQSIVWATVLIGGVMIVLLRSPGGGLLSMLPNVFPVVMVFGGLGWLGYKVDIGIMMTASVALGVAVDDTIHFLTWFRRGMAEGRDRRGATLLAYERCAVAMTQTTLVAGLGLMVFASSTFTPSQQFGVMMVTMLSAALIGDLLLLPALLCSPLGQFFAPAVTALATDEPEAEIEAAEESAPASTEAMTDNESMANSEATESPEVMQATQTTEDRTVATPDHDEPAVLPFPSLDTGDEGESQSISPSLADAPLSPDNASLRDKLRRFRRG